MKEAVGSADSFGPRRQRRALALSLVVLAWLCPLSACQKPRVAPAVDDCTLETPLVSGVPGSPGHLIASERNPNGASELAAHMRAMVDDLRTMKAALQRTGSTALPPLHPRHRKLRCAWPTDPRDRTPAFDGMAQVYLARVSAMDAKPGRDTYAAVVAACRACHEQTCDGPIAVIDSLALEAP